MRNRRLRGNPWHLLRTVRRTAVGYAVIIAIPLAIITDATMQNMGKPIEYARAEEPAPVVLIEAKVNWTHERIDKEIEAKAVEYGTSAQTLKRIVQCESGYVTDIQSAKMLSYGREKSFGLVQIHLPAHKDITYEQAINPAFAIDYLAKNYAHHTDRWSCK